MPKTVSLCFSDENYKRLRALAGQDNRSLSNFIEAVVLRYLESEEYTDEFEMEAIRRNRSLNTSLKRGLADARKGRGREA